jgi:multidrug efflux pump subunit AcrB
VGDRKNREELNRFSRLQRRIADSLETFVTNYYRPILALSLEWRYLTIACFIAFATLMGGMIGAGWVKFSPFPNVPSDFIQVFVKMPEGTPTEQTSKVLQHIGDALDEVIAEDLSAGLPNPVKHQSEFIGFGQGIEGSNVGFSFIELTKSELRDSSSEDVSRRWREKIGDIPGVRQLTINASAGPPTGLPVDIRLTGPDFEQLRTATREIREELAKFPGLFDIRDTFSEGKREIKLRLKPSAEPLGLRVDDLARQVRAAFYGAEAQRIQRGRDDVRVMVRYPLDERTSLTYFENMRIRLPGGIEIPIHEVAELEIGEGFPTITRIDRQRVINIQADADKDVADFSLINAALYGTGKKSKSLLEDIQERYPGVKVVKGGEAKDWEETKDSLLGGVILVLFVIYALLAIPFKSYLQPLIVMVVVPFGLGGAILGHLLTFQTLNLLSMLGIIALSGVVVNDSLVLVDYINKRRTHGLPLKDAIREAGVVRFRPILLTSLTTFMGLVPILLERSLQAQFLIPMATSLGFGVLFATFITLLLVPAVYLVLEDLKGLTKKLFTSIKL